MNEILHHILSFSYFMYCLHVIFFLISLKGSIIALMSFMRFVAFVRVSLKDIELSGLRLIKM